MWVSHLPYTILSLFIHTLNHNLTTTLYITRLSQDMLPKEYDNFILVFWLVP